MRKEEKNIHEEDMKKGMTVRRRNSNKNTNRKKERKE